MNDRMNHFLKLGYSIGKAFVVGEDEILQQFDRITSVLHTNVANNIKKKLNSSRLSAIRSLGII